MPKLRSLRIQNLLACKDATVHFDENGVFHVVGRNNVGKSALMNAIAILYGNMPQTDIKFFLRDNEKTLKLTGTFHDGNTTTLSRGATDYYAWSINGEEGRLDKTKGKVPEVLQRYFNLYVDSKKTKECLNIRLPRDVLTFVDTSKTDNDYLVQKALGTEEYTLATQHAEVRKREIAGEIKQATLYFTRDEELARDAERELIELQQQQTESQTLYALIETEYAAFVEIEAIVRTANALATHSAHVATLSHGMDLERHAQLRKEIEEFELLERAFKNSQAIEQSELALLALQQDVHSLGIVAEEARTFQQVANMLAVAVQYQAASRQVKYVNELIAHADKERNDFMVANNFCPIVVNTLDNRCPFGQQTTA